MPVIPSSRKALRRDRRRTAINQPIRAREGRTLRKALEDPTPAHVSEAYSAIDRAAKKRVIHPNRAARLKSRLMKAARQKK